MRVHLIVPAVLAAWSLSSGPAPAAVDPGHGGVEAALAGTPVAPKVEAAAPRPILMAKRKRQNDDLAGTEVEHPAGTEVEHPVGDDRLGTAPDKTGDVRGGATGSDDAAGDDSSGRSANSGKGSANSGSSGSSGGSGGESGHGGSSNSGNGGSSGSSSGSSGGGGGSSGGGKGKG